MASPWTVLRTPAERFSVVQPSDYDFEEHYIEDLPGYGGIRVHYVDVGPKNAHCFLCLHGEPSWSFLYRKMIKVFVEAGYRVVCPDLIGFGKSDKVKEDECYTTTFHRNMLLSFIERLKLSQVTLVCQDWGGLLGLSLPVSLPSLVSRAIIMNTTIGDGTTLPDGFLFWKAYCEANPDLDIGKLFSRDVPGLSEAEKAAYEAPFPTKEYKAGVRRFPMLVPTSEDEPFAMLSKKARHWWQQFTGPVFIAAGTRDIVFPLASMKSLAAEMKNASQVLEVNDAGHFAQEKGDLIAHKALAFFSTTKAHL